MKKIFAFVIIAVTVLSLVACKDKSEPKTTYNNLAQNSTTIANSDTDDYDILTDDELKDIASELFDAEEDADCVAALLVGNWTTDSYFVYFYDKSRFNNSGFEDEKEFSDVHKYRDNVEFVLGEAKDKLKTESNSDFYIAVKDYYLVLADYLDLLSEYPTGYSKLTYSSSITECQNECRTKRTEVEFYAE